MHPANRKNKYKTIEKKLDAMSEIIQKFSFAVATLDHELRILKDELKANKVIKTEEEAEEAGSEEGQPTSVENSL